MSMGYGGSGGWSGIYIAGWFGQLLCLIVIIICLWVKSEIDKDPKKYHFHAKSKTESARVDNCWRQCLSARAGTSYGSITIDLVVNKVGINCYSLLYTLNALYKVFGEAE
jgi:hypothetical protein